MFSNRTALTALAVVGFFLWSASAQAAGTTTAASMPFYEPAPETPTQLVPQTKAKAVARHKKLLEQAQTGNYDVYFLGDSITQGWMNQAAWKKQYEPLKGGNFGVGGDRTGNVLWRLENGELPDRIEPKVFVLLIGTNNIAHGHSPQATAEGVRKILDVLRQKRPQAKILLLGVFPRGEMPNPLREKIEQLNKIIATFADGKEIRYLYFGDKFVNADGTISKSIMRDYLHLTAEGYDIWVQSMNPVLQEMLHSPATQPAR